jgi:polar amino acid transport system substrate-binding protein
MRRTFVSIIVLACVVAGCATTQSDASRRSLAALKAVNAPLATQQSSTGVRTPPWPCKDADPTPSLRPSGPLPPPGQMPARSFMQQVQRKGHLVVGVDQNTLGFGYRGPNGNLVGFDIDLAREVARAIFGNTKAIVFKSATSAQRVPAVVNGDVDIAASLLSINCDRWQQVDFTTQYYGGYQSVLVRKHSPIRSVADLNSRTVCATAGSTSIKNIRKVAPHARIYPVALRPDCLVALQEGAVDAITADNTILAGFQVQDPQSTLLPGPLEAERYGMAINIAHPDFVRFVNAVLEQLRTNGTWDQLLQKDVVNVLHIKAQTAPPPEYRA